MVEVEGVKVSRDSRRFLFSDGCTVLVSDEEFWAVEKYFESERDRKLGRWRDPVNPDCVIYEFDDDSGLNRRGFLYDERSTMATVIAESDIEDGGDFADIAERYFAAHPKPKSWMEAEPGELWIIRCEQVEETINVFVRTGITEPYFTDKDSNTWGLDDKDIISAVRAWPAVDDVYYVV